MEFLTSEWPWYVSGPLIGLMVPLFLYLTGKPFGISSNFRHLCAACLPKAERIDFLRYDWRGESGNLIFAFGLMVGGALAVELFSPEGFDLIHGSFETLESAILMLGGGFLVGFGSRYAGGCTSGHAIMGLSSLQVSSLAAVASFFVGGLAATFIMSAL